MDIQYLKGVGPKIGKHLNSLGVYSIEDALTYYPRDYEDRNNIKAIYDIRDGEVASVIAEVSLIYPGRRTSTGKHMNRIVFKNQTGYVIGVWFNQPYIKNNFKIGERVLLYGKITRKAGETQIVEPQYDRDFEDVSPGINPIYPTNKYLSQKNLRKVIGESLKLVDQEAKEELPESIRKVYNLPDISTTLKNIHFPSNGEILNICRRRIKFEELLTLQLGIFLAKSKFTREENAFPIPICPEMVAFKEKLPFQLTNAQSRTVREILSDMKKTKPMNRLVQGDVGSGKTVVAAIALFNCAMNGFQGAMMAPTEILAEQHFISLSALVEDWGISIALITGSTPKKQKEQILSKLASGEIQIIVGTHALIQENVDFKNLALAITDEQHRFGVRQRAELVNKGFNPHVLVMTATPIPRTLALFIYGDMDMSIINELPPGRQYIDTHFIRPSMKDKAYNFVKSEIQKGRQAYVVCALVEESEKLELESAVEMEAFLKENYFKDFNVGLLHGKMSSKEKDEVMGRFKSGKIHVMVSTTVIEVGVNVPNATVMVIENADRFGLAQLHQLRGRVGRGSHKSYCVLISEAKTDESVERMNIMTSTNDGFVIAERDMELRGTGEFFGTRQHGLPELKMANILRDIELVKQTGELARELIESKNIYQKEYVFLKNKVEKIFSEKIDTSTFN